ncbi:hypothetical protein MSG28_014810 [Choristoneura fumiferana]|uniref:Uncharacterized protein n=1 Tax=Choristoneura fumiferana TaxID=7141 RepID=A0ACC0JSR8_CHOFU|nr:hypothetical protein MSG28_014810 [Choristoneura fumiferana]
MSKLSAYDSEAVGFDSVKSSKRPEKTCSTQTTEFGETGTGSQANMSADIGCTASPEELNAQEDILREYPPPGLNEFLRKVVPTMMEQLDERDKELSFNSSDSEEEEIITAKLFQEIQVNTDTPSFGSGDHQTSTVLDLSFSSAGNSLAVSIGKAQHEQWCQHDGLIRIYTAKRSADDKFVHSLDITQKNCVTVVRYHPNVAALFAYGTTSGEVVLCSLRTLSSSVEENLQLTSPSGCHGSKRVSFLMWADSALTNTYLTMQILNTGKRRGASDQVLMSSGSDGTINVWQVNTNLNIFEGIVCYNVNGSSKMAAPDISCFDFIKTYPLRSWDEKTPDDIFVVGTKCGKLFLCKIKPQEQLEKVMVDPVFEVLEGHKTCVLSVVFSYQKPGVFASVSMDSELRLYHVNQLGPLKIICLDVPATCVAWLPHSAGGVAVGARGADVTVCDARGRSLAAGLKGEAVCLAFTHASTTRLAAGDSQGAVRVWELPGRRTRLTPEDLLF